MHDLSQVSRVIAAELILMAAIAATGGCVARDRGELIIAEATLDPIDTTIILCHTGDYKSDSLYAMIVYDTTTELLLGPFSPDKDYTPIILHDSDRGTFHITWGSNADSPSCEVALKEGRAILRSANDESPRPRSTN